MSLRGFEGVLGRRWHLNWALSVGRISTDTYWGGGLDKEEKELKREAIARTNTGLGVQGMLKAHVLARWNISPQRALAG